MLALRQPADPMIAATPDRFRGTIQRWTIEGGPLAGRTADYAFNDDWSLTWRVVTGPEQGRAGRSPRVRRAAGPLAALPGVVRGRSGRGGDGNRGLREPALRRLPHACPGMQSGERIAARAVSLLVSPVRHARVKRTQHGIGNMAAIERRNVSQPTRKQRRHQRQIVRGAATDSTPFLHCRLRPPDAALFLSDASCVTEM